MDLPSNFQYVAHAFTKHDEGEWGSIAQVIRSWVAERKLEAKDVLVMLPFAHHIDALRRCWAKGGGWEPRIETSKTIASSMTGRPKKPTAGLTFDLVTDKIAAEQLLMMVPAMAALRGKDKRGFASAVSNLVSTAHLIARRASAMRPDERPSYWEAGRLAFEADTGPAKLEAMIGKVAFEWAALTERFDTDCVLNVKPKALIVVQAGGMDELTKTFILNVDKGIEALLINTDPQEEAPFDELACRNNASVAICSDFEDEAWAAASQVIAHLNAGQVPIGIIAQDRSLVRRVCALLRRHDITVRDETGWKLSTTRAGCIVMGLVNACTWGATNDQILNWLKTHRTVGPKLTNRTGAVDALESTMRKFGWARPEAVQTSELSDDAKKLWEEVNSLIYSLRDTKKKSLLQWLEQLKDVLTSCGDYEWLAADEAGQEALHALRVDGGLGRSLAWLDAARGQEVDFDDFSSFVLETLESESFVPESGPVTSQNIVVTPLPRAMLRGFKAIVFPGTDEKRLSGANEPHPLLNDKLLEALLLPTSDDARKAETVQFAQVFRTDCLTLLRRSHDGSEPIEASPLVRRVERARLQSIGEYLPQWVDQRTSRTETPCMVTRTHAVAPNSLPRSLSASQIEALRDCPYKFFATAMMGLREWQELSDDVEKRDYGNLLHAALYEFHKDRTPGAMDAQAEIDRLMGIASRLSAFMGLDQGDLLPFEASLEQFAERYVAWQRERDQQGIEWVDGEVEVNVTPEGWGGVCMNGRLDRVDRRTESGRVLAEVMDYKTGNTEELKKKADSAGEDTQMAVYGALALEGHLGGENVGGLRGTYLGLDDKTGIKELAHPDLGTTVPIFIQGIGTDLQHIRDSSPMFALGEGRVCEYCTARGICRRDHWVNTDVPDLAQ